MDIDNEGWTEVVIAEELDISRKALYNARGEIGLVEEYSRGRHV